MSSAYYRYARRDVLQLIPADAKRVLDIGCGAGALGALLKERNPETVVIGIEANAQAAEEARAAMDKVYCADVEYFDWSLGEPFDCVVFADVLEHLRNPERVLSNARNVLANDGAIVFSVPNARNWEVVLQLAEGNWEYESEGILDRTHLRFFTRREIEKLLDETGFNLEEIQPVHGLGYEEWVHEGRKGAVRVGKLQVMPLSERDAEEFYVYQWLGRARKIALPNYGLTSIIMPVHDNIALTMHAVLSIRKHTRVPYEIILVDNGSTDETRHWAEAQGLTLICMGENTNYAKACNKGAEAANGEYLLFLNNDVLVSPGWLRRMLDALNSAKEIGIVGPRTNYAKGAQQLRQGYASVAELSAWAWEWSKLRRGERFETNFISGFCMLMRRDLFKRLGGFDEQFMTWEDDDLCRRAIEAGFKLMVANDAYIHHFGGMTMERLGIDQQRLMAENRSKFLRKWAAKMNLAKSPDKADGMIS